MEGTAVIHLFNRAEVLVTYDLAHFNEARDALAAAGIDYGTLCETIVYKSLEARKGGL